MRLKKVTSILVALAVFFSGLATLQVNAANTPFTQGSGYDLGSYDSNSMQPTGFNWDRNSRFAAVDTNIHVKWTYQLPAGLNHSLVVDQVGRIYSRSFESGTPGLKMHSINPDGTLNWATGVSTDSTYGTPVISKDEELLLTGGNKLFKIDTNGGLTTELVLDNTYLREVVLDQDGKYYLSGRSLASYNPDGTQRWKGSYGATSYGYPTLTKNGVLLVKTSSGNYGSLLAVDSKTGSKIWEFSGIGSTSSQSSPAVSDDGTVYITDKEGDIFAIDSNGILKWKHSLQQTNSPIESADPIIGPDGTIYSVNNKGNLYALSPNGDLKWEYKSGGIYIPPIIDKNGIIYIALRSSLVALNPEGIQQWSLPLTGPLTSAPVIAEDGTIYVASISGIIYAIGGEVTKEPPVDPNPPVDPEPPVNPIGERAILVITLNTGIEKEYDLSMKEVTSFINWYEGKAAGSGPITFAINKHDNNKGPFKQRQDYIVFDKIITFEVNEY